MSEPRLGTELVSRFSRILHTAIAAYGLIVIAVYITVGEVQLRRSLERSTDVVESLLGLYADPEGTPTNVAPEMLAEQLIGMDKQFAITRVIDSAGMRSVYFLSPNMPAQRLTTLAPTATADEIRQVVFSAITNRARWRYQVLHRESGPFDIYAVAGRGPFLAGLSALLIAGVLLLPGAVIVARRAARRSVEATLAPLHAVAATTRDIHPNELHRRVTMPTGQADVTDLAASINRMLERVQRAHEALQSFTADASHELRTPLTHLRAQLQWAQDDARSPEETVDALSAMEREVDRTTKMVEDLLLIARGENGQLALERHAFDLRAVVNDVTEIAHAMADSKALDIATDVNGEAPALGDPDRTRHILLNLVSNAIRYTDTGRVGITIVHRDDRLGVAVSDTGPGIPKPQLDRIFDRFYRLEGSRSRAHGGSGLGLTIARVLAELQSGTIEVESEEGRGSTFTIWLPAADVAQTRVDRPPTTRGR